MGLPVKNLQKLRQHPVVEGRIERLAALEPSATGTREQPIAQPGAQKVVVSALFDVCATAEDPFDDLGLRNEHIWRGSVPDAAHALSTTVAFPGRDQAVEHVWGELNFSVIRSSNLQ